MKNDSLAVAILSKRISRLELLSLGGVRPCDMSPNPVAAALLELRAARELILELGSALELAQIGPGPIIECRGEGSETETQEVGYVY